MGLTLIYKQVVLYNGLFVLFGNAVVLGSTVNLTHLELNDLFVIVVFNSGIVVDITKTELSFKLLFSSF